MTIFVPPVAEKKDVHVAFSRAFAKVIEFLVAPVE
jgi:hypothetical protein